MGPIPFKFGGPKNPDLKFFNYFPKRFLKGEIGLSNFLALGFHTFLGGYKGWLTSRGFSLEKRFHGDNLFNCGVFAAFQQRVSFFGILRGKRRTPLRGFFSRSYNPLFGFETCPIIGAS